MQAAQASRRCPSCGNLVPNDARHCPNCGTFVGIASSDADDTPIVIDVTDGSGTGHAVREQDASGAGAAGDPGQVRIEDGPFFRSYRFGDARDGGFRGNVVIARGGSRACLVSLVVSLVFFLLLCLFVGWLFGQIF